MCIHSINGCKYSYVHYKINYNNCRGYNHSYHESLRGFDYGRIEWRVSRAEFVCFDRGWTNYPWSKLRVYKLRSCSACFFWITLWRNNCHIAADREYLKTNSSKLVAGIRLIMWRMFLIVEIQETQWRVEIRKNLKASTIDM